LLRSCCAASQDACCGFRRLAFAVLALEGDGAGGAQDQAAEAVSGGVAVPAAGAGAGYSGAWLAVGEGDGRAAEGSVVVWPVSSRSMRRWTQAERVSSPWA
jgi:hypothetical protein